MLLIPMIYHVISYCEGNSKYYFGLFDLLLIFGAQHRSVWIAAAVGLMLIAIKYPVLIKRTVPVIVVLFFLGLFILSQDIVSEDFQNKLSTQIEDIINYRQQGTGAWRYEQSQFFVTKIIEKPAFGWDFQAFESGDVMDVETFEEKGTHIHSAYVDSMYYFGILGLIIILGGLMLLAARFFKTNGLDLFFPIFAASILAYGLAYQLAPYTLFFCGIGLALINNPQKPFFFVKQRKTARQTSLRNNENK
jgi:O-antigen ligase